MYFELRRYLCCAKSFNACHIISQSTEWSIFFTLTVLVSMEISVYRFTLGNKPAGSVDSYEVYMKSTEGINSTLYCNISYMSLDVLNIQSHLFLPQLIFLANFSLDHYSINCLLQNVQELDSG